MWGVNSNSNSPWREREKTEQLASGHVVYGHHSRPSSAAWHLDARRRRYCRASGRRRGCSRPMRQRGRGRARTTNGLLGRSHRSTRRALRRGWRYKCSGLHASARARPISARTQTALRSFVLDNKPRDTERWRRAPVNAAGRISLWCSHKWWGPHRSSISHRQEDIMRSILLAAAL